MVQLAWPVRHIVLIFAGIFQQIHGEEFLPEIAPVELYAQYGFVEVLQFAQ